MRDSQTFLNIVVVLITSGNNNLVIIVLIIIVLEIVINLFLKLFENLSTECSFDSFLNIIFIVKICILNLLGIMKQLM